MWDDTGGKFKILSHLTAVGISIAAVALPHFLLFASEADGQRRIFGHGWTLAALGVMFAAVLDAHRSEAAILRATEAMGDGTLALGGLFVIWFLQFSFCRRAARRGKVAAPFTYWATSAGVNLSGLLAFGGATFLLLRGGA